MTYAGFVTLGFAFIWSGCIVAISFMESWLKFRAPQVTLPVGLGIGRIVFRALNRVEWLFATLVFTGCVLFAPRLGTPLILLFYTTVLLLFLQTFWLLPALDERAARAISGKPLKPSRMHRNFVAAEGIKLMTLWLLCYQLFITVNA